MKYTIKQLKEPGKEFFIQKNQYLQSKTEKQLTKYEQFCKDFLKQLKKVIVTELTLIVKLGWKNYFTALANNLNSLHMEQDKTGEKYKDNKSKYQPNKIFKDQTAWYEQKFVVEYLCFLEDKGFVFDY